MAAVATQQVRDPEFSAPRAWPTGSRALQRCILTWGGEHLAAVSAGGAAKDSRGLFARAGAPLHVRSVIVARRTAHCRVLVCAACGLALRSYGCWCGHRRGLGGGRAAIVCGPSARLCARVLLVRQMDEVRLVDGVGLVDGFGISVPGSTMEEAARELAQSEGLSLVPAPNATGYKGVYPTEAALRCSEPCTECYARVKKGSKWVKLGPFSNAHEAALAYARCIGPKASAAAAASASAASASEAAASAADAAMEPMSEDTASQIAASEGLRLVTSSRTATGFQVSMPCLPLVQLTSICHGRVHPSEPMRRCSPNYGRASIEKLVACIFDRPSWLRTRLPS